MKVSRTEITLLLGAALILGTAGGRALRHVYKAEQGAPPPAGDGHLSHNNPASLDAPAPTEAPRSPADLYPPVPPEEVRRVPR